MGDVMQVVSGEVQQLQTQISGQGKKVEEQLGQVRSGVGITLTPGMWEGTGAENFGNYITTQYIPEVMALIASIAGISTGIGQGLDLFQKADQTGMGQVNDLVSSFNFM